MQADNDRATQAKQDRYDALNEGHETEEALERQSRRGDLDCDDFDTRADAQAYYRDHPNDADWLDGDNDGRACEWGTE